MKPCPVPLNAAAASSQSRLLSLLRVLGRDNSVASEQMNDVLAQVATHTDASRVAGNAILYDAVQCILGEPAGPQAAVAPHTDADRLARPSSCCGPTRRARAIPTEAPPPPRARRTPSAP